MSMTQMCKKKSSWTDKLLQAEHAAYEKRGCVRGGR